MNCKHCRALQAKWYAKLTAEGFRHIDVKLGKDGAVRIEEPPRSQRGVISYDACVKVGRTGEGDGDGDVNLAEEENQRAFGQQTGVWELPRATYWRAIAEAVDSLPLNYKHRAFLVEWTRTVEVLNTAKRHGLTRWEGREAVRKFKIIARQKKFI